MDAEQSGQQQDENAGQARKIDGPVLIIGAGLVGASIGCALTVKGYQVHLSDHKVSHARVAAGLGAGTVEPVVPDQVSLVIVAVPPRALADVIAEALERYPRATVTDVGSIKASVLDRLWERKADRARYVGSHPMAGSQHSGPMTARADLFVDRTWVIAPHRRSDPESVAKIVELVAACQAREVRMDVVDHDSAVATVSHLPHLMAVLTAGHLNKVPEDHLKLAGPGLRDVTRIAGSDPTLWDQILHANAAALLPELRAVQDQLAELIKAVEAAPETGELWSQLERGVSGTRRIPGKHGTAPVDYAQVVVEIPDAPGALSRLFAEVAKAGINVEDISIEHDQVRQVGYLSVAVTPAEAPGLLASMTTNGWNVVSDE